MLKEGRHRTAVFTSELRDDLGFGAPLLCIADELVRLTAPDEGLLRAVFVVSDPVYFGHEIVSHGHTALPAPSIKRPLEISSLGRSYASLLAAIGFADERELTLRLEAWDRLFALLSPDVVIADNSPSVCLAARGRIPLLVVGSGFGAPPADLAVFPALVSDAKPETNQTLLLNIVNRVLQARGVSCINTLPELFGGDRRAVFAVPELDPYHAYRNERLLRPCIHIDGPLAPREAPSVFFSVPSTLPQLTELDRALQRVGTDISCYVPGPRSVGLTLLKEMGAHVFDTRPVLKDALSEATVVLAASADLALAAYLVGRPQVVIRADLETSVMALELAKRHTAIALEVTDTWKLTDAIREILNNSSYGRSAREEARRVQAVQASNDSEVLAAGECLELATSSRSAGT